MNTVEAFSQRSRVKKDLIGVPLEPYKQLEFRKIDLILFALLLKVLMQLYQNTMLIFGMDGRIYNFGPYGFVT